MTREKSPKLKRPVNADRPFPWRCHECGEDKVVLETIEYAAEVRHDGRLHTFVVPTLRIPTCQACGAKLFTELVDEQIDDALRVHLEVFSPSHIRIALDRLGLSQKEVADRLGIAEATLSRWLTGAQIQTKSMDRFLRVFLAFPLIRNALATQSLHPKFGTMDIVNGNSPDPSTESRIHLGRTTQCQPWRSSPRIGNEACREAQKIVQASRTTWV